MGSFEITTPKAEYTFQALVDFITRILTDIFNWLKVEEEWA